MTAQTLRGSPKRRSTRYTFWRISNRTLIYLLVVTGAAVSMMPFFWTVISSGKTPSEIYRYPPTLWPLNPQFLVNYSEIWRVAPFARWFWNTTLITTIALIGEVISATVVAYGFARFRFPGRNVFFLLTLGTIMLPPEVTLIPTYLMFRIFGWIDTFYPLTVPAFFGGGAFNIFLMRQFMLSIPFDLDEAAKIDGASSWRILWQIIIPLAKPAIATLATLGFINHWQAFLAPLIFLNSEEKYTVAVGLRYFSDSLNAGSAVAVPQDHLLMAASVLVALPSLILFFLAQRYFVQGIVTTGMKG